MADDTHKNQQQWPLAAIIAIASLAITALLLVWILQQQKNLLAEAQSAAKASQQDYLETQNQLALLAQAIQEGQRNARDFGIKQRYYTELMGLLSEIYVHTKRQDITALEEAQYRSQKAFYGLEAYLEPTHRQWLIQQLENIYGLSRKLSEPTEEYEENLLATKVQLRQMIDESHQRLFDALFQPAATVHKNVQKAP
ncbi:MAG: hypothetical protein MI976_23535 [Pseudomonadales bacterium]|nr:hypothetical protein [Pseudomonadales bacterium]